MKHCSQFKVAILLMVVICAGCAALKVVPPSSPNTAAIAIQIDDICLPLLPCSNQTLTFARLDNSNKLTSAELYSTSVMSNDRYYLLNAKPGTYVAVAASYERTQFFRTFKENILFPKAMIAKTQVQVKAGRLAVAGNFEFGVEGRMGMAPSAADFLKSADSQQAHYAKTIDPAMKSRSGASSMKFYRATLGKAHADEKTKRRLIGDAINDIGAKGWKGHIDRSMQ